MTVGSSIAPSTHAAIGETVVVVASAIASAIEPRVGGTIVWNDRPDLGMTYSLRLGLESMPVDRFVAVLWADMPFVDRALVNRLASMLTPNDDICFPT